MDETDRPRRRAARAAGVLVVGATMLASCAEPATCDPVGPALETNSSHVLGNATVSYAFHPPATGAHTPPGVAGGVVDAPIPEPSQVATLEGGGVILQYATSVGPGDIAELEALAGDGVVVAPATEIDGGSIVAFTAWNRRQLCSDVSLVDARAFIRDHQGRGPGGHDT